MCQSQAQGGRRCTGTPTGRDRARLAAQARTGDTHALARLTAFDAAKGRYGNVVTVMDLPVPDSVTEVFTVLRDSGLAARPMIVGGSVRDALIDGRTPKDIDVEVYGIDIDLLARVLWWSGHRVDEVGKAFGVLKVMLRDGTDLDVSVPRRDNHVGAGHRGFDVEMDQDMTVAQAAARRDFTVNALSFDPAYGVCVDPYNGRADLDAKILRHTSTQFGEDPLRVLRGVQFAARYDMDMDSDTVTLCAALRERAGELPVERVRAEWVKVYRKGRTPSRALTVLSQTGWERTVPGLAQVNTSRAADQADRAAALAQGLGLDERDRGALVAAVIARPMPADTARAFLNATIEGGDGQRAAYALSQARPPAPHLGRSDTVVRRWARDLGRSGTNVSAWARLAQVTGDDAEATFFTDAATRLGCLDGPQQDVVQGRDVLPLFPDRKPGPWVGQVVSAARDAQDRGAFTDTAGAIQWLSAYEPGS